MSGETAGGAHGSPPPLALTMGEPAGIGNEIAIKAWQRRGEGAPAFVFIGDPEHVKATAARIGVVVPVRSVESAGEGAETFAEAFPVLREPLAAPSVPGRLDPANSDCVRRCIERAVDLTRRGETAAVVTNPINKHAMHQAGFGFPGHTEFLGHLAGMRGRVVMMLACPSLRVVPVTIHVSLAQAIAGLTADLIVETCQVLEPALRRDVGLAAPRLALSGLNPHAGEGGEFGDEERTVIEPAIARLRAAGMAVTGPLPADTLFSARARRGYDVAVCMYHDQALIPIKALDFDRTVNVSLGLPFVRTSPDHGTACDIAGTGKASEQSLVAALRMAADMATTRARAAAAAG